MNARGINAGFSNAPYRSLFTLLSFIVLTSCSHLSSSHNATVGQSVQKQERQTYRKPPSSFADTVVVDAPTAVFFDLDPQQRKELRSTTDSVFFNGTVHECFYQMNFSRKTLKARYPDLRIEEVMKGRFLLFKMAGGTQRCIDLDTKNDACGLYIFDGHHEPQSVDMTNLETQLQAYFSQQ
jgi:hypothetical protein